jgi:4a-hydroxytetrahydrobiopterin dehydratase
MDLTKKKCKPCEALKNLKFAEDWKLKGNSIYREFKFKDFKGALQFINSVGRIAEKEGHHPDILLYSWNRVRLTSSTHAIKGLSINDFILAAKINQLN